MVTIFTPTYNRANLLPILYKSICEQTNNNFEWIVVDDGSTDNTKEILENFINEKKIPINYQIQQNKGKHFAINKGVSLAKGELFFIVDSDDYLPQKAVEWINFYYQKNKNLTNIGGVAGRRAHFDTTIIGFPKFFNPIFCNALDIRYKHKIQGDLAEVFLTTVLKEFSFPEIENEKFCPEALLWNRIAQKYKLLYFSENIYFCEYIPEGLTSKIVKIRMTSPIASMICYSELSKYKIPFIQKIKAVVNFWRFSFNSNLKFIKKINFLPNIIGILLLPLGFAMFMNDKIKNK